MHPKDPLSRISLSLPFELSDWLCFGANARVVGNLARPFERAPILIRTPLLSSEILHY